MYRSDYMTYISYCRKSRLQDPEELARQEQLVKDYCNNKGYKLEKLYSEVGSSVDADRPQYKLMMEYLNKHEGVTIIVTDYDRIGRDTLLLSLFKQLCKEHKHLVELINGTVYSYDNYTDVFTQEILSSVSSYIYQQTKAKMYRGMLQARKEGKRIGAKPFGYNIVNKRLVIDPQKADTVKRVYKLIADAYSTKQVVEIMKKENIVTNTGRAFDTRAIRLMVQNEGYTGQKGESVYPPIIDKELFLLANKQLRSVPNKGNKRSYTLSSKIKCSKCGNNMVIGMKNDRNAAIVSKGLSKTCKCMSHRYDYIEAIVKSDIMAYIENRLDGLYQKLTDDKAVLAEHQKELDTVQTEINNVKEKLSRLNRLFLLGNVTEQELQEYSSEIKSNIALLEEKQKRLENYSLYKVTQELQDNVVRLEEMKYNEDMNSLVTLIDHVDFYKSSSTNIVINTIFKA